MTVGVAAQLDLPDARKWHFPKEFHAETTFDESKIYPQRAPDGGGAKGRVIDNRWITPCAPPLPPTAFMYAAYPLGPLARYSPYLLLKYHCHQRRGVQVLLEVPVHSTVPYRYVASKRPGDVGSFL